MADKVIIVFFVVYLFDCLVAVPLSTKKLVIDHDGGADDAFAITLSLLNEKYFNGPKVVALTTTFGNINLTQTIINSDRILALCDRLDVPIYSGANQALISNLTSSDDYFGYDGLGDEGYEPLEPIKVKDEPAAVALIKLSKKYEGELTSNRYYWSFDEYSFGSKTGRQVYWQTCPTLCRGWSYSK